MQTKMQIENQPKQANSNQQAKVQHQSNEKKSEPMIFQLSQEQVGFLNSCHLFSNGYSLQYLSFRQTRVRVDTKTRKYNVDPLLDPIKKDSKNQKIQEKIKNQSSSQHEKQDKSASIENHSKDKSKNKNIIKKGDPIHTKNKPNTVSQTVQQKKPTQKVQLNEDEQRCLKVFKQIKRYDQSWLFRQPIDPKIIQLPKYYELVKQPMDLKTVQTKLQNGQYKLPGNFNKDVKLIFQNFDVFKGKKSQFYDLAVQCKRMFQSLMRKEFSEEELQLEGQQKEKKETQSPKHHNSEKRKTQPKIHKQRLLDLMKGIKLLNKSVSLQGILKIVYDNKVNEKIEHQINLQDMQPQKFIQLQNFVKQELLKLNKGDEKATNNNTVKNSQTSYQV